MSWHRSSGFSAVAMVVLALLTASPAWGATAGIDRESLTGTGGGHPGDADFGSGFHANGVPTGPYSVTWDFTPAAGVVQVSARVQGTLYLDRLGSGLRARLLVDFQDLDFNLLARRTFQFCGPGFDANNSANQLGRRLLQRHIANFPDARLRHVQLTIGSVFSHSGAVVNDRTEPSYRSARRRRRHHQYGTTDVGGPGPLVHAFGSPVNRYSVTIELQETGLVRGQLKSDVNGILFWDSAAAGTACLSSTSRIRLADSEHSATGHVRGAQAATRFDQPTSNSSVSVFHSASGFKIRMRVGTGAGPVMGPAARSRA